MRNLTKTNNKKDRGKTDYFTAHSFTAGAHPKQLIFNPIRYLSSLRTTLKKVTLPRSWPAIGLGGCTCNIQVLNDHRGIALILHLRLLTFIDWQKYY